MFLSTKFLRNIFISDEPEDGESHRSKHTALTVLKNIGFSSNLLSQKTLDKIKEKCSEELKQEKESEETFDFSDFVGTGSLVLSKIRNRCHRSNLLKNMMTGGTVLNMRKDIHIRKELRVPPNKVGLSESRVASSGGEWPIIDSVQNSFFYSSIHQGGRRPLVFLIVSARHAFLSNAMLPKCPAVLPVTALI